MTYIVARFYDDESGVVGLNGKQYLLDDENKEMLFESEKDAKEFLLENGIDIDDDETAHLFAIEESEVK